MQISIQTQIFWNRVDPEKQMLMKEIRPLAATFKKKEVGVSVVSRDLRHSNVVSYEMSEIEVLNQERSNQYIIILSKGAMFEHNLNRIRISSYSLIGDSKSSASKEPTAQPLAFLNSCEAHSEEAQRTNDDFRIPGCDSHLGSLQSVHPSNPALEEKDLPQAEPSPYDGSLSKEEQDMLLLHSDNLKLPYRSIKNLLPPSLQLKKVEIQKYIKQQKDRLYKQKRRTSNESREELAGDDRSYKRFKASSQDKVMFHSTKQILDSFMALSGQHQRSIIELLSESFGQQPQMFQSIFESHLDNLVQQALSIPHTNEELLMELFDLPPQQRLMLNLRTAQANPSFIKGRSIYLTLLPCLNMSQETLAVDPPFINIAISLMETLIPYVLSTHADISKYFVSFLFEIQQPNLLNALMGAPKYATIIRQALLMRDLQNDVVDVIMDHHRKFFWHGVFSFLEPLQNDIQHVMVKILSQTRITVDPTQQLTGLYDYITNYPVITTLLLKVGEVPHSLEHLLSILGRIHHLEEPKIKECLQSDINSWDQRSLQLQNKNDHFIHDNSQIQSLYAEQTERLSNPIPFEVMEQLSVKATNIVGSKYLHDQYQCAISGIVVSHDSPITIVSIPPASGKSFMIGLIALHYITQSLKVVVIVPNKLLQQQLFQQIGIFHESLKIRTITEYYQYAPCCDVVIIDEFDEVLVNNTYLLDAGHITGLWSLNGKKTIGFTATIDFAQLKVITTLLSQPLHLIFKSSYQFVSGSKTQFIRSFKAITDQKNLLKELIRDVETEVQKRPVICFLDEDQRASVMSYFADKVEIFCDVQQSTLQTIMARTRGLMVLDKTYSRGYDTKFKKDAVVVVGCIVNNIAELDQMLGRASRTRNACEGIIYVESSETADQILQRLEQQSFVDMQNLMDLCKMLMCFQKLDHKMKSRLFKVLSLHEVKSLSDLKDILDKQGMGCLFKRLMHELDL